MNRRYNMPFGAECRDDGSVRFRLWAPAARKVELCLTDSNQRFAMNQLDGGWFELNTDVAKPGAKYKFRINDAQEVPDPASRFQPNDVHGPSQVIRPHQLRVARHPVARPPLGRGCHLRTARRDIYASRDLFWSARAARLSCRCRNHRRGNHACSRLSWQMELGI